MAPTLGDEVKHLLEYRREIRQRFGVLANLLIPHEVSIPSLVFLFVV